MKKCIKCLAFIFLLLALAGCTFGSKTKETESSTTTNATENSTTTTTVANTDGTTEDPGNQGNPGDPDEPKETQVFVVTFNSNEGSAVESQNANDENSFTITEPADPTKTGHEFVGWYSDVSLESEWNFANKVDQDKTLYAKWTPIMYTVSFQTFVETIPGRQIPYGSLVEEPTNIINDDQEIAYWYYGGNRANIWNFATDKVTGDLELFIEWQDKGFDVTLSAVDATNSYTQAVRATSKNNSTITTVPTRSGNYIFAGYYSSEVGGVRYYDAQGTQVRAITEDITLYARWSQETYTVTLNGNSPTYQNTKSATVAYDSNYVSYISTPSKTGYTFTGWYASTSNANPVINTRGKLVANNTPYTNEEGNWAYRGNAYLYAGWQNNKYTITLNNNVPTTFGSTSVEMTYDSSSVPTIINPTKLDNAFQGWYYEDQMIIDYTGKLVANTSLTNSMARWIRTNSVTLIAKWGEANNTITFNSNEATTPGSTEVLVTMGGDLLTTVTNPVKTNYEFLGWFINDKKLINANGQLLSYSPYTNVESKWIYGENIEVIAKWQALRWNINLYNSSASISGSTTTLVEYMGDILMDITNPIRYGYSFAGWYSSTNSNGILVIDSNGQLVANANGYTNEEGKWNYGGSRTLYSKWIQNAVGTTIMFDDGDATTAGSESVFATYNTGSVTITNPIKEGNVFYGWYDENGNIIINADGTFVVNNLYTNTSAKWYYSGTTLTLYAHYVEKIITVSLNQNGGQSGSTTVKMALNGDILTTIKNPTKTGYTFAGWSYNDVLIINDNELASNTACTTNGKWSLDEEITLMANWEPIKVLIRLNASKANIQGTKYVYATFGLNVLEKIQNPIRYGYRFTGWYYNTSTLLIDVDGNFVYTTNSAYVTETGNWKYRVPMLIYLTDGKVKNMKLH